MDYVAEAAKVVEEVMPWDLEEELKGGATPLILDIREPYEFDAHRRFQQCASGSSGKCL